MSTTNRNLIAAHAEVKAEIARTDTKTALLLAFVGAVLAGTWSLARDLPLNLPAIAAGGLGLGLLVAAAGLLLRSTRPNLGGRHGFPLWATLTPDEIGAAVARDLAADIVGLSRLAVAKFTCLRRAVDLTMTAGALLILAALLTTGGAR
ncbi:integral membrane plasmid transfer protein [Streptomyces sp. WAC05374]|uniref:Pycsar system effector family protein n=1 Tax=Streptomyces sp. WAC05374 TaxID=2487420 RepID=UPI000F86CBD7|nr:Pycsar system effector family protein [Streptomyces sp. WAC05374]RST19345.1 integral membrane plasmid transfer protein [Streptomyces sp. WAC05374]TDF47661.1 integral membrane plasmid transfer protein [Streptomyces sp. WAC05374]TDF48669.1 integral membrane plasmid transfer protein [Streptomyces sp. WAC05374]TDF59081.1 integral membrane plasmid transfer protein [Streptomyces sp. WAC05374]